MVDVLGAMSSLGSAAINYKATMDSAAAAAEQAQKNRDFEMSLANKQRAEALADRAHSEMYNSPLMERMRREAAGLGPVDDYSTPASSPAGLQPDYAEAASRSSDALVSAAQLGASAPMSMMQGALQAAKLSSEIMKDRSIVADNTQSARVKASVARLNEEGLQDDLLRKKLENDQIYQENSNLVQEGLNLVEQGYNLREQRKLTRSEIKTAESNLYVLQQTQEMRVDLMRHQVKHADLENRLDEFQLNKVLPKQLQVMDSEISRARAAANLANNQSRRINVLLPFEKNELQNSATLLGIAVKTGTIEYDESVVKHNKFMSHLKEYEDALVANYKISRQEANWYSIQKGVDILSRAASTVAIGVGVGKALAPISAVSNTIKNGGLQLPGSGAYERFAGALGNSIPPLRQ